MNVHCSIQVRQNLASERKALKWLIDVTKKRNGFLTLLTNLIFLSIVTRLLKYLLRPYFLLEACSVLDGIFSKSQNIPVFTVAGLCSGIMLVAQVIAVCLLGILQNESDVIIQFFQPKLNLAKIIRSSNSSDLPDFILIALGVTYPRLGESLAYIDNNYRDFSSCLVSRMRAADTALSIPSYC